MRYHLANMSSSVMAVGFCLFLSGCAQGPSETPAAEPIAVTVSRPIERSITDYADFTARTAAVDSVELRARVWGYLDKVNFKEGAMVKAGDVLFEIDPRTYRAALDQAEGNVASLEARVQRLTADLARAQRMVGTGALSREDYDKVVGDRGEAAASRAALKAAVERAKLDLGYTKVIAPISGRISRYIVTVGNLVQAGDQAGGTLLTTIVSVDPMYAYFDVDEHTVLRVRKLVREGKADSPRDGAVPVALGLANQEGFPHQGTINFVDNQVNPKTGTMRLRGVFANKDQTLAPGFFARVRVPIGRPHKALLVSERALDTDQGQKIVFVVDQKNEVASRPVELGALHDGLREITDGLKPGERVIVNGLQQVRPGITVEPKLVDMPAGSQRSEVRGQNSELRGQRSEVRGRRSEVSGRRARVVEKGSGILNHAAEDSSDLGAARCEIIMFLGREIFTVFGKVERGIGLAIFAVAVGQFGDEMSHVAPFSPGFAKAHAYGSRRPTDLSRQRVSFLGWKPLAHPKNQHRKIVSLLVNGQILCRSDDHGSPPRSLRYALRSPIQCPV